jgi:hypothetical protein
MHRSVGLGAQRDDGKRERPGLVLFRKQFVNGQEHIKFAGIGDEAKQFAIADAGPTGLWNGFDDVPGELTRQILRQTFVEQDAHSGGGEKSFGALFQKGDCLLARDRGILLQKLIESLSAFDVIQQRADGNASAGEARFTTQDFRIDDNDGLLFHASS